MSVPRHASPAFREPIIITTRDGRMDADLFLPVGVNGGPLPAVLFYMDAIAIRPALFQMASRLASHGYAVLLPNLYYRLGATGSYPPFDPLMLRDHPPERERMMTMMRTLTLAGVMEDSRACFRWLNTRREVSTQRVGCVGYCMGGGMALTAAGTFPDQIVAAASFHGGGLATDKPDSPHLLASKIKAKLHIGVAELDTMFSAEQGVKLQEALQASNVDFQYEVYSGAKHGFAVTGHSAYDAVQSERHWEHLTALLKTSLSPR